MRLNTLLPTIPCTHPSYHPLQVGILIVEMRFNDARRNMRLLSHLEGTLGFEMVIWRNVHTHALHMHMHRLYMPTYRARSASRW